jgi:hypothetical protein
MQIYFQGSEIHRIVYDDIERLYPGSISRILSTEGIGGIVYSVDTHTKIFKTAFGEIYIRNGSTVHHASVGRILESLGVTKKALDDFIHYCMHPHVGDIVIFGAKLPDGSIIGFENQQGLHGGWFGDMMWPFVMTDDPMILSHMKRDPSMEGLSTVLRKKILGE